MVRLMQRAEARPRTKTPPLPERKDGSEAKNGSTAGDGSTATRHAEPLPMPRAHIAPRDSPKRLFRIPRGEWIMGVCNGLAAYFSVDVTMVRVLFVLLAFSRMDFGLRRILSWQSCMPVARTEEELAAAHGTKPFNAHDFIEQAKARAEEFRKEFDNRKVSRLNRKLPARPPVLRIGKNGSRT